MRKRLPNVGDVMRMLGFENEAVYAYYILASPKIGPIIQVYVGCDAIGAPCDVLKLRKPFPSVLCGIAPPVREGGEVGHRWLVHGV